MKSKWEACDIVKKLLDILTNDVTHAAFTLRLIHFRDGIHPYVQLT